MNKDFQNTVPNILKRFAHLLGSEVKKRRLEIPKEFGSGYCTGFVFNEHIRMLISNYELKEDLVVENPDLDASKKMIFFKFQNIFPQAVVVSTENRAIETPSVLIATSRMNTDEVISIHTNTAVINIEMDADYLNSLFDLPEKSHVLKSLLQNAQPLLFEQTVYISLQKIVDEIVAGQVDETFELFFLRVKAEELICRLLIELQKRDQQHLYPLSTYDIQIVYRIKEQMLTHLDIPPVINELSLAANMSPSKLKRLFKQIFGISIFNYYQGCRMKEAARMLRDGKLTVSEVGYQLGFTNLSHFSKVFEEHIGMKPKKWSMAGSFIRVDG